MQDDDEEPLLSHYTIMFDCLDIPGAYVVRRTDIFRGYTRPGPIISISDNITFARVSIPHTHDTRIVRSPEDEPQVVETWI